MKEIEMYDEFFLSFDEFTKKKYKRFFETYKLYTYGNLNVSRAKNKKKDILRYILAFKYLIENADKDLDRITEGELYQIVLNETSNTNHRRVLSRYFNFLKRNKLFDFTNSLSFAGASSIKTEEDFYTLEEWSNYANMALDIDNVLPRALKNVNTARCWLYLILHLCVTWRKGDILSLPAMDNLIGIEKYTLQWFEENTFTLADAGYVINNVKLYAEQYLILKTGAKKHFNIPLSFYIPVALAIIAAENWRRVQKRDKLFGTYHGDKDALKRHFGENMKHFSSLKANRTLLSLVDEKAEEIGANDLVRISSYMRSHKVDGHYFSDQTSAYLRSTYSDQELHKVTMMLYDRGMFGWMYDSFLQNVSGEKDITQKQETYAIAELRKNLPADKLNEIAGILSNQRMTKENALNEILALPQEQMQRIFSELHNGERISRQKNVYCLKPSECNNKVMTDCAYCPYSIPTVHLLFSIRDELDKIFLEIDNNSVVYKYDRIRTMDKMLKLFSVIKEAMDTFGEDFVNTILPIIDVKQKMIDSYEKLRKEDLA